MNEIKPIVPPPPKAIDLIRQATQFGREQMLVLLGEKRLMVSRREAQALVGKYYLDVWEKSRLVKGYKKNMGKNGKIEYDRLELQQLQLSETYHHFMN